jgi:hypothetical protein
MAACFHNRFHCKIRSLALSVREGVEGRNLSLGTLLASGSAKSEIGRKCVDIPYDRFGVWGAPPVVGERLAGFPCHLPRLLF